MLLEFTDQFEEYSAMNSNISLFLKFGRGPFHARDEFHLRKEFLL